MFFKHHFLKFYILLFVAWWLLCVRGSGEKSSPEEAEGPILSFLRPGKFDACREEGELVRLHFKRNGISSSFVFCKQVFCRRIMALKWSFTHLKKTIISLNWLNHLHLLLFLKRFKHLWSFLQEQHTINQKLCLQNTVAFWKVFLIHSLARNFTSASWKTTQWGKPVPHWLIYFSGPGLSVTQIPGTRVGGRRWKTPVGHYTPLPQTGQRQTSYSVSGRKGCRVPPAAGHTQHTAVAHSCSTQGWVPDRSRRRAVCVGWGRCWKKTTLGKSKGKSDGTINYNIWKRPISIQSPVSYLKNKKVQQRVFEAYSECYFNT